MKSTILGLLTLLAMLISPNVLLSAESGEIKFCKSISEQLEAIEPNTEFDTNEISLLIYTAERNPFAVLKVVLSIYNQRSDSSQELIHRETRDINPDWNILAVKDIPLPETGTYYVAVNSDSGQLLSSGLVTIKAKDVEIEIPDEAEMEGGNLKSLFESYKSKAVPSE